VKRIHPYLWLLLVGCILLGASYVASQDPHFTCDRCRTSFTLLKGGYRSIGVYYCHGFQPESDGGEDHFYHWPKFYWNDLRGLQSFEFNAVSFTGPMTNLIEVVEEVKQ
jgi:hypothetical protein